MFDRLLRWLTKGSQTTRALVAWLGGQPAWTPANYAAFAREGYAANVYVYACVRQIAMACGGVAWALLKGSGERRAPVSSHPLLDLLARPNPLQGWGSFIEGVVSYLLLAGNAYIEAVGPQHGAPRELYALRPDRMLVKPGNRQQPIAGYLYRLSGQEIAFSPEAILHLRTFNPLDDWYGLSPVQAVSRAIDQNNESKAWNVGLLQNCARPPGALVTEERLSEAQYERLHKLLAGTYAGASNAGRPLLLEGGLKWQHIGLSPADMDWLEGQKLSAREIAVAFGVPPELIGDTANKTYSNYQEARRAFYEETVLPLMDWLRDELNAWLAPRFGPGLRLEYDRDDIEALQGDRQIVWRSMERAWWLTVNERRAALGYGEIEGGDVILAPAGLQLPAAGDGE